MNTTTSSQSSLNEVQGDFESLNEYFATQASIDDISDMSETERLAYFEKLYADSEITEEEFADFLEKFEEELDAKYEQTYVSIKELEAMIESGNLTAGETASLELVIQDLEEILALIDGDAELLDSVEDAKDQYDSHNQVLEYGDSTTVSADELENGTTVKIDATETEGDTGTSSAFDAAGEGMVDSDQDGVKDVYWDQDNDNIADDDFNNDGVIDEKDNPDHYQTNPTSVTIELEEGDSLTLASYDDSTDPIVSTFKIAKENGDVVYVEITGEPTIYSETVPSNLETIPTDLTGRMFESTESKHPYSYYTDGFDPALEGDFNSIYKLEDSDDASLDITPSDTDFDVGRSYDVYLDASEDGTLNLAFPEDATIDIDVSDTTNRTAVMTVTNVDGQQIVITIHDIDHSFKDDHLNEHIINITGGEITEETYSHFYDSINFGWMWIKSISQQIFTDEESLYDSSDDEGYSFYEAWKS